MTELRTKELGSCQVRSGTAQPCSRRAVVEIRGMPFCEPCAREQEAYFAIGKLTDAEESVESLAVVMGLMRKIRTRHRTGRDLHPDAA